MKRRDDYPERTIITTWQISFDEVERRDIAAAKLLRLWGYLDNQELWYQLLWRPRRGEAGPDWLRHITATEITFLAAVGTLSDFSLIEQNDNSETYSMHAVVHDWIQASINTRKDDSLLQTAIISLGRAVPRKNARDSTTIQRRLLPHLIQLLQYWSCVTEVHDYVNNAAYLHSLHMLGNLCADQGKPAEAEKMYQWALQRNEKGWGPEHILTLNTVHDLGNFYTSQGELDEAEKMYQRALQGYEKAWGPGHTLTLNTVHGLGILCASQGKLEEAEKMYQRALQGIEKGWGPEHTLTLDTVYSLGFLRTIQGKLDEAEKMYQRALQGYQNAMGADNTMTNLWALNTIWGLGSLFERQADLAKAKIMYSKALVGYEKVVGPGHLRSRSLRDKLRALDTRTESRGP